jgi:hypothetical protein
VATEKDVSMRGGEWSRAERSTGENGGKSEAHLDIVYVYVSVYVLCGIEDV